MFNNGQRVPDIVVQAPIDMVVNGIAIRIEYDDGLSVLTPWGMHTFRKEDVNEEGNVVLPELHD